ncbi:phosphate ABC transporter substrate-binding protein PstS [Thermostichus vulcanus]|uniref:Phosphate-binding protein n=1 Tax=Thermostichus vulcanus str. 'Rupite' TaxID=2813851 RepID=A0ABT0C6P1_THEVL|nr:phosphate ABC transporter substrate-binding protein PstS [Thermostichus vulcanus]MCJ2541458.1 phosphate ABC transporter substrate-binding protein PstS [Thermostichus vulcanus str. 'Rupite']
MLPVHSLNRRFFLKSLSATVAGFAASQADWRQVFAQQVVNLNGAGASFPAPIYQTWAQEFGKQNPNIQINYQSVGSGAGRRQFVARTVDFGATDSIPRSEEIAQIEGEAQPPKGMVSVPMVGGAVVAAYNIPGVSSEIRLSRLALTNIFLGKITKWNDTLIASLNPRVTFPDLPITVVHRSDGSGTTEIFTSHLNAVNTEWRQRVGRGSSVNWPAGVGARGNEGVSEQIKQIPGAIGYVEFGFAKLNNLAVARLENRAGKFVTPTVESEQEGLGQIQLNERLLGSDPDPLGEASYPIVSYTWILAYRTYANAQTAQAVQAFLRYGLNEGQAFAEPLGYVPLPDAVRQRSLAAVDTIQA